ncbi:hypothetical protein EVAR_28201_1 [Eumeta japonica]|uniref:Uncharacterized protein n=1 Tax=Eumeta variegata TaxID=151549 RepID=A0A4C1VKK9_EUMVA|nr:hypothetical protein EVAR_28201_1 [Eumeta japonica]
MVIFFKPNWTAIHLVLLVRSQESPEKTRSTSWCDTTRNSGSIGNTRSTAQPMPYFPLHRPSPPPTDILFKEAVIALMTSLGLRVSMDSDKHLFYGGSQYGALVVSLAESAEDTNTKLAHAALVNFSAATADITLASMNIYNT